ncbi:restriction endonuclease subunit S [Algibacter mikhailovii]|uniref:restriction endonuclease subunit S n=1 Tax=Algibacter mikhailovii TaxID=425498 RepID=UPI002493E98B|nr:restriction endonuclease subunit S [Algibacter mikhailovii]
MEFRVDKSNWTPVKLGDVFTKREENDRENAKNKFDRFLKGGHMDSESLHIRRWGSQKNGEEINPTFYKIFRKGQILFQTRRPYLRKTVFASFDGICGEKTLTLEPIEEFILPQFMPFLFHSESFYAHTSGSMIGSTNPHCRWRDVANYEFLLPPKEQQVQIASLLWAMDDVIEKELKMLNIFEIYKKANYKKIYSSSINRIKLGNSKIINIISSGIDNFENTKEYISTKCVENYKIIQIEELIEYDDRPSRANMQPVPSSVWFAKMKDTMKVIKPTQREIEKNIFSTGFCGLKVNTDKVNIDYVFHYLLSDQFNAIKDSRAIGTTQLAVNNQIISTIPIPLPNLNLQNEVSIKLNRILFSIEQLKLKLSSSKSLQKSLINQVF